MESISFVPEEEQVPRNRRTDLYVADTPLPLYGALLRGVGRPDWTVAVVVPPSSLTDMQLLKERLGQTPKLHIYSLDDDLSDFSPSMYGAMYVEGADSEDKVAALKDKVFGKTHFIALGKQQDERYKLISTVDTTTAGDHGVHYITGDGKGKTTYALGQATEGIINGDKTAIVQFFKQSKRFTSPQEIHKLKFVWDVTEHYVPDMLTDPSQLVFDVQGAGFYGSPQWDNTYQALTHQEKAEQSLERAKQYISSREYKTVVLDEFGDTPSSFGPAYPALISEDSFTDFLLFTQQYPDVDVVVTGHDPKPFWQEHIKTETVITKVKHPYDEKQNGKKGLD